MLMLQVQRFGESLRGPLWVAVLCWMVGCSPFDSATPTLIKQARHSGLHSALIGAMQDIPGGSFIMGDATSTQPDERPTHRVQVPAFRMGVHEVTREQYLRFVQATAYSNHHPCWGWEGHQLLSDPDWGWQNPGYGQDDDHPAACISWQDAQAYVHWLNQTLSPATPYRLPSEAEWEYAARAGSHTRFPWGDSMVEHQFNCWVCDDGYAFTSPAGHFPANAFGIHDMSGNVWEWVQDCYVGHYHNASSEGAPWLTGACASRIVRGGSWGDNANFLRAAYRVPYLPSYRHQSFGFRLAQDR